MALTLAAYLHSMERRGHFGIAALQCAAILSTLVALALRAPVSGAMLVVPLGTANTGALADVAVRHGGSLLGTGPVAGSLVVYGTRASLEPALWAVHAVVLAAPSSICGAAATPSGKRAA